MVMELSSDYIKEQSEIQPVGRTGWDVLSGSGKRFTLLFLIVVAAAMIYLFKDDLGAAYDLICENWFYIVPFILGFAFYRQFVLRMVRNGVIIHVIGIDHIEEYDVARSYLETCNVEGIQNFEYASNGESLLYATAFDPDTRTIMLGWNHDKDTSIVRVLTIKGNYQKLTDENYQLAREYYRVLDENMMLAKVEARKTVEEFMDFFAEQSGLVKRSDGAPEKEPEEEGFDEGLS